MIGWYHSGPKLRASDQEINDLFKRYIARPVMVIVDVRQQAVGIPTDAYFAVEEIKDVSYLTSTAKIMFDFSLRTVRKPERHFYMFRQPSRRKKLRKLALNTCCAISRTPQQPHCPLVSVINLLRCEVFNRGF